MFLWLSNKSPQKQHLCLWGRVFGSSLAGRVCLRVSHEGAAGSAGAASPEGWTRAENRFQGGPLTCPRVGASRGPVSYSQGSVLPAPRLASPRASSLRHCGHGLRSHILSFLPYPTAQAGATVHSGPRGGKTSLTSPLQQSSDKISF